MNTLPLRADLSGNPSFRQLLVRAKEVVLGAHENHDFPFDLLVKELQPERNLSYSPLFQVLFDVESTPPGDVNLNVQVELMSSATSKFDLSFYVKEFPGGMRVAAEYCTDLFGRETIRRMLGHFMVLLKGIIANPDEHIDTLPLLTAVEQQHFLAESNKKRIRHGRDRYLDELFEEQIKGRTRSRSSTIWRRSADLSETKRARRRSSEPFAAIGRRAK